MTLFLENLFTKTIEKLESESELRSASGDELAEKWLAWLDKHRSDFYSKVVGDASKASATCICAFLLILSVRQEYYKPNQKEVSATAALKSHPRLTSTQIVAAFATNWHRGKSLETAGQKLLDLLYKRGHPKPFFICFDEAHTLARPVAGMHQKTPIVHLEWALSHLRHLRAGFPRLDSSSSDKPNSGYIFTLFMSTNSVIVSSRQHQSHQMHADTILFPPFTELPLDVFTANIDKALTLQSMSRLNHAAKFGRPLYASNFQSKEQAH